MNLSMGARYFMKNSKNQKLVIFVDFNIECFLRNSVSNDLKKNRKKLLLLGFLFLELKIPLQRTHTLGI
jgi:hypothetical protein